MHVVINDYTKDPPATLAIVELVDGKIEVKCSNEKVRKNLLEDTFKEKGIPVSARDGRRFLEALPHIFMGSRIKAVAYGG
jgi:hypothetical protein